MLKTQLPVSLRPRLLRLGWETISLVSSCLAEEVFTQFLRWVADWKENVVIHQGGVSHTVPELGSWLTARCPGALR